MNIQLARNNLLNAVRLVVAGLEYIGIPALKGRDHREPGWREKEAIEDRLRSAITRHFAKQRRKVREYLENEYPNRKALDYWDDEEDEEAIAELMLALQKATRHGIDLFGQRSKLQIDWTMTNTEAAQWAREYVYDLIKYIDKTSREALQDAISQFVETPGMTLRDTMDLLPYDEERAQRIAVTETTRAYSKADQLAGDKLKEAFPDVKIVSTWFTNNDELVCELCGELDGAEVADGETFYDPEPPYEDGYPPRHVGCRCWIDTSTALGEEDSKSLKGWVTINGNHVLIGEEGDEGGGGGGGTSGDRVRSIENDSGVYGSEIEHVYAVDDNGDVLFHNSGGTNSVEFSDSDIEKMNDAVMTHNHPSGNTFSEDDIELSTIANVREVRATGEDGTYIMTRPTNGWGNYSELYGKAEGLGLDNWMDSDRKSGTLEYIWKEYAKLSGANYRFVPRSK